MCTGRRYFDGKYNKIFNMKSFTTLAVFYRYTVTSILIEKSHFSK